MKDIRFTVELNEKKAPGVYLMRLTCAEDVGPVLGGQFLQFEVPGRPDLSLRRPFCIYKREPHSVTLVYVAVGEGTRAMAEIRAGQRVNCLLPLGNGFVLPKAYKRVALVGGGVGGAPLLPVIGNYPDIEFHAYLGFGTAGAAAVLAGDFEGAACALNLFTDDGSAGVKGFPTAALDGDIEKGLQFDAVLTCGPAPLIKAVRAVAVKRGLDAFMSGENRMACGVGACLTCACAVRGADGKERNLRACVDGPVFDLKKVQLF
ncbi:MAG: dihydroorotate dehydrogenase electron transfer subunit [Clostridiales bacterium]|jgi:dihydroorotate dehydrogenase electron transfer subunit|nr:dihydroorotate dehydrogenase electron transfer subunit [Clostridiales bacterium]